jgi:hypothetical protein
MTGLGKKTAFWLVACFSVAMAPQLLKMPLLLAALTLTPVLWRVTAELKNWKPVSSFTKYALTAVGLVSLFVSYGGLAGRRAAVSLLTLMLALKLLECYRIRDARLLVCFTLFLATTQFLFTQNILMPVYGFVVIMFALGTLAQLQRNEAWFTEGSPPVVRASLLSELGFGLRILALAVPVGLAFFIFFPRLASPLWGIPESTLDAKSGLSGSMSPGSTALHPPQTNSTGVARSSGASTEKVGTAAFTAEMCSMSSDRTPAGGVGPTVSSWNPTSGNGYLPSITPRPRRRTLARPWIFSCSIRNHWFSC